MIKAALAAGFYPQLLRVEHPPAKFRATEGGAVPVDAAAVATKFFDRVKGRVFLHPSSVNFNCARFESGWLIYTDMVETSKVRPVARPSSAPPLLPGITAAASRRGISCVVPPFGVADCVNFSGSFPTFRSCHIRWSVARRSLAKCRGVVWHEGRCKGGGWCGGGRCL